MHKYMNKTTALYTNLQGNFTYVTAYAHSLTKYFQKYTTDRKKELYLSVFKIQRE